MCFFYFLLRDIPACNKRAEILPLALAISVARIFDWEGGANHKLYAMTSSKIFERETFLGKDIRKCKTRSRGLVYQSDKVKMSKLRDVFE